MARRKRQFLEDDLDSSGGSDGGSDDEEGANDYRPGSKRRRKGKDDAIYGAFADESEEEDKRTRYKRQDITK